MVAETYLLGQQSGLATKELERVRPSLAISFLTLAMGSMPSSTTSWSSVRMNTKFGRFFCIEGYIEENFVLGFPLLPQHSKYFPSFMETISTFGNTSKCSLSFKYFFFIEECGLGIVPSLNTDKIDIYLVPATVLLQSRKRLSESIPTDKA